MGAGSGTPHEKLETGPSSDVNVPEKVETPTPAASSAATHAVVKSPAPAVENSTPVEKSAQDDVPVKTLESTATPVASAKVKVFIM